MQCNVSRFVYCIVALIWNIAVLAVACFLLSWLAAAIGSLLGSEITKSMAFAVGLMSMVTMFWFGIIGLLLSLLVKCKQCKTPILTPKLPFFAHPIKCSCRRCQAQNT